MIMHVAEAGEQRGRVVLQLSSSRPNPVALEAAFRIAQAFRSEIESLFVEDRQLVELASFPFAREISLSGRTTRALSPESIAREMRLVARAVSRRVEELARQAEVPLRCSIVQDEPVQALATACAEHGPWNVVAFADHNVLSNGETLREIIERVSGTTGLLLVGPEAKRTNGPVVVVVEDMLHFEPMVRSAMRLLREEGDEVALLLIADDPYQGQWMESQARLALGDTPGVRIASGVDARGSGLVVAEVLRRLKAGFIIGQFGGILIPADGDLRHLASSLECPLFVMR
ncbi:MAG: hypothetical protein ACM31O_11795 [Bacteroidota bacterium]|jgi:hypothetical protein